MKNSQSVSCSAIVGNKRCKLYCCNIIHTDMYNNGLSQEVSLLLEHTRSTPDIYLFFMMLKQKETEAQGR